MLKIILIITSLIVMQTNTIVDINKNTKPETWSVVDDVVMGGRSSGRFDINDNGHGVFHGKVSLENNGGFSSLRHRFEKITTTPYTKIVLRVKGDGKSYQFRVKTKSTDYYSYISYFETTNDWQSIEILLEDMYPAFRGRKLDIPNYSAEGIEEIAILIGNKKAENFRLEIDKITLN